MDPIVIKNTFLNAYEDYADAIFRHCYFRLSDRERAKELMQETFVKAWDYLAKGEKIDNLRALLYRIATNLVIDDMRKKKEYSLDALQEKGFNPGISEDEQLHIKIESDKAKEMIEKLPEKYRQVVTMRYIDELSPKEIAQITKETENSVSVKINRGLAKLRNLLKV